MKFEIDTGAEQVVVTAVVKNEHLKVADDSQVFTVVCDNTDKFSVGQVLKRDTNGQFGVAEAAKKTKERRNPSMQDMMDSL